MITFHEPTTVHLPDDNGEYPTDETHTLPAGTYEVIDTSDKFITILDDPDGCNWMVMR